MAAAHVDDLHMIHFVAGSEVQGKKNRFCVLKKAQIIMGNGALVLQSFGPSVELVRRSFNECKATIEQGSEGYSPALSDFVKGYTQAEAIESMEREFDNAQLNAIVAQGNVTPVMLAFVDADPSVLDKSYAPNCGTTFDDVLEQLEQSVTTGYAVRKLGEFNYSDLSPKAGSACAALPEKIYKKIDSLYYPKISVSPFEFDSWAGPDHNYFGIEGGRLFWHRDKNHFFSLEGLHFFLQTGFTLREAFEFLRENPIKDPNKPLTDRQQKLMAAYRQYQEIAATATYESVGLETPILCGDGSEPAKYVSWDVRLRGLNDELGLGKDFRNSPEVFTR